MNHTTLYLNDTWISSYQQLCDILRECDDVSSTLSREFIEAAINGVIPAWLRQIGKINEADAISQLIYEDDDKDYVNGLKKALLDVLEDNTCRPLLLDYAELVSVSYSIDNSDWAQLGADRVINLPPDFRATFNLKIVFRPKNPVRLSIPLILNVRPLDYRTVVNVAIKLRNDPINTAQSEDKILGMAKALTEVNQNAHLILAGETKKETIELLFNNILETNDLSLYYDYHIKLYSAPDKLILDFRVLKCTLQFEANGVLFFMKHVDGGIFSMGGGDKDDNPVHKVELSSYYIGETVVTQALWKAVTGSEPSINAGWEQTYGKGDDFPAYRVSYDEIENVFLTKLRKLTGKPFRLPTEAEWEFAARGGNEEKDEHYKYSGSDDIDEVAWYYGRSGGKIHPVKEGKWSNSLGIYGMSGNVFEWCHDWYNRDYYQNSPQRDPKGPYSGHERVTRGGSFFMDAEFCRVSRRSYAKPDFCDCSLGFRLAL